VAISHGTMISSDCWRYAPAIVLTPALAVITIGCGIFICSSIYGGWQEYDLSAAC
jgi:hypothetical protein